MLPQKLDLGYFRQAFYRRKWYIIITFFLVLALSVVYVIVKPRLYRASTLILVQGQTMPTHYVNPTVTASLSQRISTIKDHVTSRSILESLINKYDLYASKDPSEKEMIMEEKVELMRKNIDVLVHQGAAFRITFIYQDPIKVMKVANDLTAYFMEENLRIREEQSTDTTKFLESEAARLEEALRQKDETLTAYKQKHMGGLPDELQTNFKMLQRISEKVTSIERSLDEARTQKIMIQGQLSNLQSLSESLPINQPAFTETDEETTSSSELLVLMERLKNLLVRYTENHPDVVKIKKRIAHIRKNQQETAGQNDAPADDLTLKADVGIFAGQLENMRSQLDSIEETIRTLQSEKAELEKKAAILATRIEETPKRQMELTALQRDYSTLYDQYQSLISKKLQSELAANMELRQKGEQFIVVDRAKVPEKPFRPNVPKILLAGIFAGLTAGFGLALGIEYLDQSFMDYKEISEFLQIPLLAVIPRLETAADARKKHHMTVLACCIGACLLLAIGIGVWLWVNGNLQAWVQEIRAS